MIEMKESQHALYLLEKELKALTATPVGRRKFLQAVPTLLASVAMMTSTQSCSSRSDSNRQREGDNSGQETELSVKDEEKMTQEYLPEMLKEYPPHPNQYAQSYLNNLGQKIVQDNGWQQNPYRYNFRLVQTDQINAFALPAGEVFVTAPLLRMSENEAELVGVLGHEVGHVRARHTAERMDSAKKEQAKGVLFAIGGGLIGGALGFALGKKICRQDDKDCLHRIALYGGLAGAGGGLLIQKFAFMANSREDEMEADRIGMRAGVGAGYNPEKVGSFYEKLLEMEKKHKKGGSNALLAPFADALSTHPPGEERVAQMRQMSREIMPTLRSATKITSPEFEKVKKLV